MPSTTIRMPQLGESVVEGTIGKWLVGVGQRVAKDQPVVEILTDKADSEVPAPDGGIVTKLLAQEGDVVQVGAPLCEIDPAGTTSAGAEPAAPPSALRPPSRPALTPPPMPATSSIAPAAAQAGGNAQASSNGARQSVPPPSSPSVRKLAREQGIDLGQVAGSGDGGRVTRDDVMRAVAPAATPSSTSVGHDAAPGTGPAKTAPGAASPLARPSSTGLGAFKLPPYIPRPGDEVVPMSRRRRIIADHMVFSKLSAPHVVTFAECDLHKTEALRKKHKEQAKAEGVNLTMLAFVAAAVTRALREHRSMNARVLEDAYVLLKDIHLGIAVDTPDGLVVPVVRNADELTVRGLARSIDALALKARDGTLSPDDLAAKTFTISNPGKKGNLVGGAIISQPNVGILRTGEITKRVVVVEHEGEDLMAIHPVMHVALSYDHRVVDGVAANGFLYRVVELLEAADFSL